MLSVPPPTRVALGTLHIGGQKVELFVSTEWARYFQSLNNQLQANTGALAGSAPHTALLTDGTEAPEFLPAPGRQGPDGAMGLALFLLQDDSGEQALLLPPSVDGVYVPLNSKDAPGGVPGLTQLKLNLKNVAGTITSWFTTVATVARTWTMPDKDGTVAVLSDFAAPPAIGNTTAAAATFTTLTAGNTGVAALTTSAGFGCNGKTAQPSAALGAAATDLPTVITLANNMRTALINNGIGS